MMLMTVTLRFKSKTENDDDFDQPRRGGSIKASPGTNMMNDRVNDDEE